MQQSGGEASNPLILQTLLQEAASAALAQGTRKTSKRNPLYPANISASRPSKSTPTSPVAACRRAKAPAKAPANAPSKRRGPATKAVPKAPLPGLGVRAGGTQQLQRFSLTDFSRVDHIVFGGSRSAPSSPARPDSAQLESFSALRLSSLPGSPQGPNGIFSAPPSPQQPSSPGQRQQQQQEEEQQQPYSPEAGSSSPEHEDISCSQPEADSTPSPPAHPGPGWSSAASFVLSPLPELSPMQISPFPPATQQHQQREAPAAADSPQPGPAGPIRVASQVLVMGAAQMQQELGDTAAAASMRPSSAADGSCGISWQQQQQAHQASLPAPPPSAAGSGAADAEHPHTPAAAWAADASVEHRPGQGHGGLPAEPAAPDLLSQDACSPPDSHMQDADGQEHSPALVQQEAAAEEPPPQRRRHGYHSGASSSGRAPGPVRPLWHEHAERLAAGQLAVLPQQQQQSQQQQQQEEAQAAPAAPPAVVDRQEVARRRAAEDAVVDATCPPVLRDVLRHFPSQKEAFAFADRCNSSQPQAAPAILISRMAVPADPPTHSHSSSGAAPPAASGSAGAEAGEVCGPADPAGQTSAAQAQPRSQQQRQQPHQQQQRQQPDQPGPGTKVDFLSRYSMGLVPTGSGGYHTSYAAASAADSGQERGGAVEQAAGSDARTAAREQYRNALRALQPPGADLHAGSGGAGLDSAQPAGWQQQQQQLQSGRPALPAAPLPVDGDAAASSRGGPDPQPRPGSAPATAAPEAEEAPIPPREEPVRVFCLEKEGRNGVWYRQFVAASYPAVWREYRRTPMVQRHWYEVIREGRPCHLYFDLECPAACNPGLDMDALVACLLHHVDEALGQHFGLAVDYDHVYEFDSCTETKHSRHLLIRIPGHAFINNHAMGQFVGQVISDAGQELMVVRSEEARVVERGSIVDVAVYSRNRHFRMVWNCKGGKTAVLVPTRRFATQEGCGKTAADVFLAALICHVDASDTLLQMPNPIVSRPSSGHAGRRQGGAEDAGAWGGGIRVSWKRDVFDDRASPEQAAELKQLAERAVPFIEQVATQRAGGQPAQARTLAFCGFQGTVAYSMIGPGSHYCENIGRFHQSNHVFFVVNFSNGTFSQKCHDPDCYHYRSAWMPLPPELCLQPLEAPPAAGESDSRSGRSVSHDSTV